MKSFLVASAVFLSGMVWALLFTGYFRFDARAGFWIVLGVLAGIMLLWIGYDAGRKSQQDSKP